MTEVEEVAIWPQAADDGGAGRSRDGEALEADGDFAIVADAHAGLLAPDVGPPRAGGNGAQDGAVFGEGLLAGGVGGGTPVAVEFVLGGVGEEVVQEAGAGVVAGSIIQEVEQNLFVSGIGEEGVRCGVILPEGAVIAGLPALDGFAGLFVAGVGSQLAFNGPAAHAGAVGFEAEAAEQFAGSSAVGGRGFGGEKFCQQDDDLGGPARVMITARADRRPSASPGLGADS